jgi:hypothetical protein
LQGRQARDPKEKGTKCKKKKKKHRDFARLPFVFAAKHAPVRILGVLGPLAHAASCKRLEGIAKVFGVARRDPERAAEIEGEKKLEKKKKRKEKKRKKSKQSLTPCLVAHRYPSGGCTLRGSHHWASARYRRCPPRMDRSRRSEESRRCGLRTRQGTSAWLMPRRVVKKKKKKKKKHQS